MTQKTTMSRFDVHIPFEITFIILSKLPVKSILRFKSVCKTWYDVIQNPNFTEKHRAQSSLIPNLLLLDYPKSTRYPINVEFSMGLVHHKGIYYEPYYPILNKHIKMDLYVVGISNGLVCMRNHVKDDKNAYIFNPSTRQFRQYQVSRKYFGVEFFVVGTEFGSDSNYWLLSVVHRTCKNGSVTVCAEKCNISTGNWINMNLKIRNVHDCVPNGEYTHHKTTLIILHGVFYWVASFGPKRHVVCLDFCNATYDEIRFPEEFVSYSTKIQDLIELKGELALILHGVEFWVLNEDGRTWTKKLTIKESPKFEDRVLGCGRNGELLVHHPVIRKSNFCLFDLNTEKTKTLSAADRGRYDAYIYTESLLSV